MAVEVQGKAASLSRSPVVSTAGRGISLWQNGSGSAGKGGVCLSLTRQNGSGSARKSGVSLSLTSSQHRRQRHQSLAESARKGGVCLSRTRQNGSESARKGGVSLSLTSSRRRAGPPCRRAGRGSRASRLTTGRRRRARRCPGRCRSSSWWCAWRTGRPGRPGPGRASGTAAPRGKPSAFGGVAAAARGKAVSLAEWQQQQRRERQCLCRRTHLLVRGARAEGLNGHTSPKVIRAILVAREFCCTRSPR